MNWKLYLKWELNLFVLIIICVCISQATLAQKFTLAILPDTQCEVNTRSDMFMSQMQWIADNKDSLNIPIVLHVGDVVDFNNVRQYETASEGFKILDKAKIPYAITLGNHDTNAVGENTGKAAPGDTKANLRITKRYNSYFPVKRFTAQKGRFEKNKSDNSYHIFKAGGLKWLVVTLEFCSRQEPVTWAGKIISKYPNHNVIILTHSHLDGKGAISESNAGYGFLSPKAIYDQMIRQYSNIRLVLSGHTGSSAYRDDIGLKGNHIYQILQNYATDDKGGGYIRLLEIDPDKCTMSAKIYTPFYNRTRSDASLFSFSGVKFVGSKE